MTESKFVIIVLVLSVVAVGYFVLSEKSLRQNGSKPSLGSWL